MNESCIDHGLKGNNVGYAIKSHEGYNTTLHRVIYCKHNEIHLKEISGLVVRHTCDNTRCINPNHLILGTQSDNMKDKVERDRQPKGEDHYASQLTEDQVKYILSSEKLNKELAEEFNVSYEHIRDIKRGKRWKHLHQNVVYRKGNSRGENNGNTKLKENDVIEIFKSPLSQRKLAKIYGVGQSTIGRIKNGQVWKHLTVDKVEGVE